jgi:hypothetical protein
VHDLVGWTLQQELHLSLSHSLSCENSIAFSKAGSLHSAIPRFHFQVSEHSLFHKVVW